MDTAVAAYLLDPSSGDYSARRGGAAPGRRPGPAEGRAGRRPAGARRARRGRRTAGRGRGRRAGAAEAREATTEALRVAALVPIAGAGSTRTGCATSTTRWRRPLVRVLARMEVVGIRGRHGRAAADRRRAGGRRPPARRARSTSSPATRSTSTRRRSCARCSTTSSASRPGRKTKTGYSTDAATLESLRDDHPIVDTLLRYREVEKLRSTYGESLLAEVADDGRIHASFRQTVARTGRLSSERPNLHNIPVRTEAGRRFRRAFVPAEGCRFLVADYDQIELRVHRPPVRRPRARRGVHVRRRHPPDGGVRRLRRARPTRSPAPSGTGRRWSPTASPTAWRPSGSPAGWRPAWTRPPRSWTGTSAAFPAVRAYMEQTVAEARRPRLHPDRARPQASAARAVRPQLPGPPGGRAPGHERRDPGAGGRPVQGGPRPARPRARATAAWPAGSSCRSTTR